MRESPIVPICNGPCHRRGGVKRTEMFRLYHVDSKLDSKCGITRCRHCVEKMSNNGSTCPKCKQQFRMELEENKDVGMSKLIIETEKWEWENEKFVENFRRRFKINSNENKNEDQVLFDIMEVLASNMNLTVPEVVNSFNESPIDEILMKPVAKIIGRDTMFGTLLHPIKETN